MGSGSSREKERKPANGHSQRNVFPREPAFEQIHIPEEEEGYPPVTQMTTLLSEFYRPADNAMILEHALKTPKDLDKSWEDLVKYLTDPYKSTMKRVRSIFVWLGLQKIEDEEYDDVKDPVVGDSPRCYMKLIKDRSLSYAGFFCTLCRKTGVPCVLVKGISKGIGYEVGNKSIKHLHDKWNAVYIHGWWLIHPLWAYKSVVRAKTGHWALDTSGKNGTPTLNENNIESPGTFNEYFFFVDPAKLKYLCLPRDEKWQLQEKFKMTYDDFVNMPLLQQQYFAHRFKIISGYTSILKSDSGVCGMTLKTPNDKNYQFSCELFYNHVFKKPLVQGPIHLKNYVLFSHEKKNSCWTFEVRIVIPGSYRLAIYGGLATSNNLAWVCDVGVEVNDALVLYPYPDFPMIGFGPVYMTEQCGLVAPSHTSGMLFVNPRQEYHITFNLTRRLDGRVEMVQRNKPPEKLKHCISSTFNNLSELQLFDICFRLPQEGEYSIRIFVKDRYKEGEMINACNYYVTTTPPRENGVETSKKSYENSKLRRDMRRASLTPKYQDLKKAVENFEDAGLRDKDGDYEYASNELELLSIAKDLRDAINRSSRDCLEAAIDKANNSPHKDSLVELIEQAEEMFFSVQMSKYTHDILEMKPQTLAELLRYRQPLPIVFDTLKAVLLLLGTKKALLSTWESVRAAMKQSGPDSLMIRMSQFDINNTSESSRDKAASLIQPYDEDAALKTSAALGTFYMWVKTALENQGEETEDEEDEEDIQT